MKVRILDPISNPSGREIDTNLPVWRVELNDFRVLWAFVEADSAGHFWVTGYPSKCQRVQRGDPIAGFIVGASAGAILGGSRGDIIGLVVGAAIGGFLGVFSAI